MSLGSQAIQEAVQKEVQKTALRMLEEKLDIHLISRMTNLSIQEIKQLVNKKSN